MSRFLNRDTYRFELGDGDWVELLEHLSLRERQAVKQVINAPIVRAARDVALRSGRKDGVLSPEEITAVIEESGAEPDLAGGNLAFLYRAVIAWGGPGFCLREVHPHDGECTPQAVSEQAIDALGDAGDRILEELERRSVARRRDFTKPGSQRSAMEAAPESTPSA